eukprot:1366031-Amorphochlora_amoeboformis.AAC.1
MSSYRLQSRGLQFFNISEWTNIGGNKLNASQNTDSKRPTFKSDAASLVNGYSVVRFDGVDDWMRIENNEDIN